MDASARPSNGTGSSEAGYTGLADRQRHELDRAVVEYLSSRSVAPDVLDSVKTSLGVSNNDSSDPSPVPLVKKWAAVVRLQRQVLELKQQLQAVDKFRALDATQQRAGTFAASDWLPSMPCKHTLLGHRQPVVCLAFHPSWLALASGSEDGQLKLWDAESGDLERTVRAHTRAVTDVHFSSLDRNNHAMLASCSSDMTIKIWDPTRNYALARTFQGHEHTVSCVRFLNGSQNNHLVASASRDKTVRIWDLNSGYCIRIVQGHTDWVRTIAVSHDGMFIISGGNDRCLRVWPVEEGPFTVLKGGLHPNGTVIGSRLDQTLTFSGHDHVIECLVAAPHSASRYLDRMGPDPPLQETDGEETSANILSSKLGGQAGNQAGENRAGQPSLSYFASGSRDKTIRIWSVTRREVACLRGHENWVRGLVWHPNGRFLMSSADDRTVRVWDLANSGRLVRKIEAHDHFVSCLALAAEHPDAPRSRQVLATGSVDASIKIWA